MMACNFFAMVGFSDKARSIAKRAFSHHYTKDSDKFNDMDEVTMKKYNMDKNKKNIILDEEKNKEINTKKVFKERSEEDLANGIKNDILEKNKLR